MKLALSSDTNLLNLRSPKHLPGRSQKVPFVLTRDDAFSLTMCLMKPLPQTGLTKEQRIFNYRLLRMRRISENGFGIRASRCICRECVVENLAGALEHRCCREIAQASQKLMFDESIERVSKSSCIQMAHGLGQYEAFTSLCTPQHQAKIPDCANKGIPGSTAKTNMYHTLH
ncbi:hypothetical protein P5673_018504 [Acropora cervicornis]|uniref:Uncharacterized protein n=1 Tax=Acropora cervicornis TaxID=6130 RepID=A0AAD9V2M8_ACRCE|nr:hypothetical protein P5673_018504 [Acropora cervicornis]